MARRTLMHQTKPVICLVVFLLAGGMLGCTFSQVRLDRTAAPAQPYVAITVGAITAAEHLWEPLLPHLRHQLLLEMRQRNAFPIVLDATSGTFVDASVVLSGRIMKVDKGSEVLRRFVGFGAGKAQTPPSPPCWKRVIEALMATPGYYNNKILSMIDTVMIALQNPKRYAEVLGDAWDMVKAGKAADINDALLKMAEATGRKVTHLPLNKEYLASEFFTEVATKEAYWVDHPLRKNAHGAMTHLLQDLVVDRALGGPGKSAEFRVLLGKAEGMVERYERKGGKLVPSRFTRLHDKTPLPNTVFIDVKNKAGDLVKTEFNMQTGDYVWRFTYDLFYKVKKRNELKAIGRLPHPEWLRSLLNELADVGMK
jgi:hypothetical protein